MNEDDARRLLLVRAVEIEDSKEVLLTREDRQQATSAARSAASEALQPGKRPSRRSDDAFLAARANFAYGRLETRFPAVARASRVARWPAWLNWSLPLAAFLTGMATNEIGSGRRLDIIAFPLLGMIAWNLAVYLLLLARAARQFPGARADPKPAWGAVRLFERIAGWFGGRPDAQPALAGALARFTADWSRASARLAYTRASRTLHVSAAALAAGVITGMYLRALGIEYRAGWESTFMSAPTLHGLLALVLGPASALTGIPLPDQAGLQSLRWSEGPGQIAGPWIHLYATTALIFIVAPRLVLAAYSTAAAARRARRIPVPGREDFYIRRLLRGGSGEGSVVRIIPYSFHPPAGLDKQLRALLTEVLGDRTQVTIDTPIAYGDEDDWLAGTSFRDEEDHLVVLFNLSSTPESENHGALVGGIRKRVAEGGSGASVAVLLDESGYRSRLAGQSGAEGRIESRRQAWRRMLTEQNVEPLFLDLDNSATGELTQRLEGALIQGPLLAEARASR